MSATDPTYLLEKYADVIAEEVNVKEISLMEGNAEVKVQYNPLGSMLGASFGKDTGRIIGSAKKGNIRSLEDGQIEVFDGDQTWVLSADQYEVRYMGFDGKNQTVEGGVMVELDLTITDELRKEGVAREISRFLNQMRKDADYDVSDRITVGYISDSAELNTLKSDHGEYLQREALVSEFVEGKLAGDLEVEFENEGEKMMFTVKK